MLLARFVVTTAAVAVAPRIAGEFSSEFTTAGSESQATADLIAKRFPGTSGDTIEVVWHAPRGVRQPTVQARVQRFLDQAERLEGIAAAQRVRVSRDGTIALTRLDRDRRALDVPQRTSKRLIDLAETASGHGLQIELGGPPIRNAQEGGSPEFAGLIAAVIILLVAFGSVIAVGLPIAGVVGLPGLEPAATGEEA